MARAIAARSREPDDVKTSQEFAEAGHGQIGPDGKNRDQPLALAVLGDQREAAPNSAGHVALADRSPLDEDPAGRVRTSPHHAVEELAAARAHQAVDAEDLAFAHGQRDVIDLVAAGQPRQADVLGAERLVADRVLLGLGEILRGRSDHLPNDPADVDVGHALAGR